MAEIIQIKFKVDGKEITATEKDLKELQRATKGVQGGAGKAKKSIDGMGVAFKALGALAAAAAMVKFAADTAAAVKEIGNLASRASMGTTEFQKQAFAAQSVGVEADKLADIYKDVNDKLGDFIQTGAGPLADFFDGIGKQMGVTIDDFKELSSDQALGLYVKTLESANVSQQEMTFFMEAIASDATLLTPLLRNNAEAMNELGEAATGVLSTETIEKAAVLDSKFKELAGTIKGQVTTATIAATTAMLEFLGVLDKPVPTKQEEALARMAVAAEQQREIEVKLARAREINNAGQIAMFEGILDRMNKNATAALDGVVAERQAAAQKIQDAKDVKAAKDEETAATVKGTEARIKAEAAAEVAALKRKAASETAAKALESEMEALANLADPMKQYTDKLVRIQELMEQNKDNPQVLAVLSGAYLNVATAASTAAEAAERVTNASGDETAAEKVQRLADAWNTNNEKVRDHVEKIRELAFLYDEGEIGLDEYKQKLATLGQDEEGGSVFAGLADELSSLDQGIKQSATDSVIGLAEGFADMAVSGEANMKQLAAAFIKQIAAMIIKALILKAIMAAMNMGSADAGPAVPATGAGAVPADSGGQGSAGDAFLIGTGAQPELFVPQTAGQFIPKQQMLAGMSGGGVTIGSVNVVVKESKDESTAEQANKISKAIQRDMKALINSEITNQSRSGNMLNPVPQATFR